MVACVEGAVTSLVTFQHERCWYNELLNHRSTEADFYSFYISLIYWKYYRKTKCLQWTWCVCVQCPGVLELTTIQCVTVTRLHGSSLDVLKHSLMYTERFSNSGLDVSFWTWNLVFAPLLSVGRSCEQNTGISNICLFTHPATTTSFIWICFSIQYI